MLEAGLCFAGSKFPSWQRNYQPYLLGLTALMLVGGTLITRGVGSGRSEDY